MTSAAAIRQAIRAGVATGPTAGLAPGYIQANIVILPTSHAAAFSAFCRANHQSCPLLAVSDPGDPALPTLGEDIDIRHDLPGYRIFRDGVPQEASDIAAIWRSDFVTFAIGCSFTFEAALIGAGIELRHVSEGKNVAMFRTDRDTLPSGPFGGKLVVSMRPIRAGDTGRAAGITAGFPDMHGAPIHAGDPGALGIADLGRPDYGDAVDVGPGEVPVFWACGVTSQVAVEQAGLPLFVAHAPGKMLITDRRHPAAA